MYINTQNPLGMETSKRKQMVVKKCSGRSPRGSPETSCVLPSTAFFPVGVLGKAKQNSSCFISGPSLREVSKFQDSETCRHHSTGFGKGMGKLTRGKLVKLHVFIVELFSYKGYLISNTKQKVSNM